MLEIIATSVQDAQHAIAGGADSLEIIYDLSVGGLTPAASLVQAICALESDVCRNVILRPHARNFEYSADELAEIIAFINRVKNPKITTFVFGALTPESTVNHAAVTQIAEAAHPVPLTFHRAIDYAITADDDLKNMHASVTRILASGMALSAWEGREQLAAWVSQFGTRFQFALAGGVNLENIADLYRIIGAQEYHIGSAVRKNGMVNTDLVKSAKARLLAAQGKSTP